MCQGTKASAFLFTNGNEILPPIRVGDKEIVFLQLVPLFLSELEYKKKNGEQGLWSAFESKQVSYWDSCRIQVL